MVKAVKDKTEQTAELTFYIQKRAISDCFSKHRNNKPLFKNKPTEFMTKEQNYKKFDNLLTKFNKKGGEG